MERITGETQAKKFIDEQIKALREQIGDSKVLLALSGGVDSSVTAAFLIKAIGKNLVCVHVNHGLLRKGEPEEVVRVFRDQLGAELIYVDAVDRFLNKLAGVTSYNRRIKYRTYSLANSRNSLISGKKSDLHFRGSSAP